MTAREPLWREILVGAQMLFVAFGALVLMPKILSPASPRPGRM